MRHKGVDVGFRLYDRAHVVVVAKLQAFIGDAACEFRHFRAKARPVLLRHMRALRERNGPVAVNRVRRFRCNKDVRASALGHRDMRLGGLEFLARRAPQEFRRIPAADEDHAELRELRLQRRAVARHLVALFHAFEAGFPALPRGRSPTACRRRFPASRRWTNRSGWRRGVLSWIQSPMRRDASAFS